MCAKPIRFNARILFSLLSLAALAPPPAVAAPAVVSQAAVTVSNPAGVQATFTLTSASPFVYDSATRSAWLIPGAQVTLSFSYSAVPSDWEPGSAILTPPATGMYYHPIPDVVGPTISSPISTAATFNYTVLTPYGGEVVGCHYGWVVYRQLLPNHQGINDITLAPAINIYRPVVVVQTRGADGKVQDSTDPFEGPALLEYHSDSLNSVALTFDVYVYTVGPESAVDFIPAAGVDTRISFKSGYTTAWAATDANGSVSIPAAGGGPKVPIDGNHRPDKFYVKIGPISATGSNSGGYMPKTLALDGMGSFDGTLHCKVTDPDGNPLRAGISLWGGPLKVQMDGTGLVVGATGEGDVRVPRTGAGTAAKSLAIHVPPLVKIEPHVTQFVDDPTGLHNKAPAFLSPRLALNDQAYTYDATKPQGTAHAVLRLYNGAGQQVGSDIRSSQVRIASKWKPFELLRGLDRYYHPVTPTTTLVKYSWKAFFENKDEGAREPYSEVGSGGAKDVKITHVPAGERPFNFQFVGCLTGGLGASSGVNWAGMFFTPANQSGLCAWLEKFFLKNITFSNGPNLVPSSPFYAVDIWRLSSLLSDLEAYRARTQGVDFIIGIVPPGELDTWISGNSSGLSIGGYPNTVLIDASRALDFHGLHEFLHTRGLPDNYGTNNIPPASADGYDPAISQPVVNLKTAGAYSASQALMYDYANSPWPTAGEYSAILGYAATTVGVPKPQAPRGAAAQQVMSISALVRRHSNGALEAFTQPIFTDWGQVYAPTDEVPYGSMAVGALTQSDTTLLDQGWQPVFTPAAWSNGTGVDPAVVGIINLNLPWRSNIKTVIFASYLWPKQFNGPLQYVVLTANAPKVTWGGPAAGATLSGNAILSFTATDADPSPTLYALVKFSPDAGTTWYPTGNYFPITPGANQYTLNCSQFPSTKQGKLKILVSDGGRTGSAESGPYTISGYAITPTVRLGLASWTVTAKSPVKICIPLPVRNIGGAPLDVILDPASLPAWLSHPSNLLARRIMPGGELIVPIQGALNAAAVYKATLKILTNDPAAATISFPVQITVDNAAHAPEVVLVAGSPPLTADPPRFLPKSIRFTAWEKAGGQGLNARITIERLGPSAILTQNAAMIPGALPGEYDYDWTVPAGASGKTFGVEVTMTDSATGLADKNGSVPTGYDLAFTAARHNRPPVFTTPAKAETTLTLALGQNAVFDYAASDPDGDPLIYTLHTDPDYYWDKPFRWDQANRKIYFNAGTQNGRNHKLILTAFDPSGIARSVSWQITVAGIPLHYSAERAYPTLQNGKVLTGASVGLWASCYNTVAQQGCRFEWRKIGQTAWSTSGLRPYTKSGSSNANWTIWDARWTWDLSKLTPAAEYELRSVNINPAGKADSAPPTLRVFIAGQGGAVQSIQAPTTVRAGSAFQIEVLVKNLSSDQWSKTSGHKIAVPGGATDPFTKTKTAELHPFALTPPQGTAIYELDAVAPATPGVYKTRWQPSLNGQLYGTAGEASIAVVAAPPVPIDELRSYLLGHWAASATWLDKADINGDKKIDAADLVRAILISTSYR